jgi:hypothetical protein
MLSLGCGKKMEPIIVNSSVNTNVVVLPDATGKKMSDVKIKDKNIKGEFDGIDWTFSRKFSQEDVALAKLSIAFVEKITGLIYVIDYNNMYWSDDMLTSLGTNRSLLGMTVFSEYRDSWRAYIAITSKLRPPSPHDLNAMRDFGSTVIHECLHAGNLDIEETVRAKIERPIDMSFDLYCFLSVSNFYAIKLDRFTNSPYSKMIEKAAFEAGIKPPWHYTRDYMGDPIRPVIQLFMIPPPTNSVRIGATNN